MKKIYDTVIAKLQEMELHYTEEDDVIRTGVRGNNTNIRLHVVTDEERELLFINLTCPQEFGEKHYDKLLRWINKTNYNLVLGYFTLDEEDGELAFRITLTLDNGAVNDKVVEASLLTAMTTVDNRYPALMKHIYADADTAKDTVVDDIDTAGAASTHTHFNS